MPAKKLAKKPVTKQPTKKPVTKQPHKRQSKPKPTDHALEAIRVELGDLRQQVTNTIDVYVPEIAELRAAVTRLEAQIATSPPPTIPLVLPQLSVGVDPAVVPTAQAAESSTTTDAAPQLTPAPIESSESVPFEPATLGHTAEPYVCNVPMCGESGVCAACRARGAR